MANDQQPSDPSALTTSQLWREIAALKELLETRLTAMDKAIRVAHEDLTRVPTDVQERIANLKELHAEKFLAIDKELSDRAALRDEKFAGVQKQFDERDIRSQHSEAAATTAVNAALSAQKELSSKQAESFSEATQKSEQQFTKQIDLQGELLRTEVKGLVTQIDEVKERLNRGEGIGEGSAANKIDHRASTSLIVAMCGLGVAVVLGIAGIIIAVLLHKP
jgi:hypothetical protein